jgi:hypothetical protein
MRCRFSFLSLPNNDTDRERELLNRSLQMGLRLLSSSRIPQYERVSRMMMRETSTASLQIAFTIMNPSISSSVVSISDRASSAASVGSSDSAVIETEESDERSAAFRRRFTWLLMKDVKCLPNKGCELFLSCLGETTVVNGKNKVLHKFIRWIYPFLFQFALYPSQIFQFHGCGSDSILVKVFTMKFV